MIISLVVFLVITLVASVIAASCAESKRRQIDRLWCLGPERASISSWDRIWDTVFNFGVVLAIIAGVALLVLLAVYSGLRLDSTSEVAEIEAFYDATVQAYETTAESTGNVNIYVSDQALIDAGYWEQGAEVSNRLAELRDKIDWYNSYLNRNRHWNDMWLVDDFVADAPDPPLCFVLRYRYVCRAQKDAVK